jgi:hypothetical protein
MALREDPSSNAISPTRTDSKQVRRDRDPSGDTTNVQNLIATDQ